MPLVPHNFQNRSDVPSRLILRTGERELSRCKGSLELLEPELLVLLLQFTLDERLQAILEKL